MIEAEYQFREFQVRVETRTLQHEGATVELGSRAFDLLAVLLRSRGTVVSKTQLMQQVWPSTIVDECNLRFQMACLRRVLGRDRDLIKTIQGRGYLFVVEADRVLQAGVFGPETPPPTPKPAAPRSDGPAIVAVVEDDENTRHALDGLLRSSGFLVETYPSSQDFMGSGRAPHAECLILDIWLPGRSGLEFQADLKGAGMDVPIVFISGHADIHMSVRAMKAGAFEFLTKPVRHEELLEAIHTAVAARRKPSEMFSSDVMEP